MEGRHSARGKGMNVGAMLKLIRFNREEVVIHEGM